MRAELESYFDRLWPICRSITGDGLRASLKILSELMPLEMTEVPTGTRCFDWEIPREWNIQEAWIETPSGERIADFSVNNLHVWNYSSPVDQRLSLSELKSHVRTLSEQPDAIPYVTTYYKEQWGFCMTHRQWEELPDGEYRVFIDSSLEDGSLTYGQAYLPGESKEEVLFSTYLCHPSMANNELSGPLVAAFLYRELAKLPSRRYSYRFLLAPETIGVIAFLDAHGEHLRQHLHAGYVLTCCGDKAPLTYKMSKRENSDADRVVKNLMAHQQSGGEVIPFAVGGSDERQYCSPGFNLPVGSIIRSRYQTYPEYHTSLDNKEFISFPHLEETVYFCLDVALGLELNQKYTNRIPNCEPQLGKRGLYPDSVNPDDARDQLHRLLHLLTWADGQHDLVSIAEKRGESFLLYQEALAACIDKGLIEG